MQNQNIIMTAMVLHTGANYDIINKIHDYTRTTIVILHKSMG